MEAKAVKNASSFFNSAVIANSKMDSCVLMRIREKCFVAFNALLVCSFVLVVSDVKVPQIFFRFTCNCLRWLNTVLEVCEHMSFAKSCMARERLQLTS